MQCLKKQWSYLTRNMISNWFKNGCLPLGTLDFWFGSYRDTDVHGMFGVFFNDFSVKGPCDLQDKTRFHIGLLLCWCPLGVSFFSKGKFPYFSLVLVICKTVDDIKGCFLEPFLFSKIFCAYHFSLSIPCCFRFDASHLESDGNPDLTVLHYAIIQKNKALASKLIELGADVNLPDR